ncbi:MAG: DUF2312 domain-containing protein [Rickettsiales bacterium]|jgi:uncharacterized protein (UPF0335 family)|nr:DUF2312 domain-containing protein [Rickettsiales bacterium]
MTKNNKTNKSTDEGLTTVDNSELKTVDNSKPKPADNKPKAVDNGLKTIVQRIENQEDQKQDILDNLRDIYKEARINGYDVKILRKLIQLRKRNISEVREEQYTLELYQKDLGMEL